MNRMFRLVVEGETGASLFEGVRLMVYFNCHAHLMMAAMAFNHLPVFPPGLAGAFLDAANQFVLLAFDELQIIIRKLRKFLFQLAFGNVPVSFGYKRAHIFGQVVLPQFKRGKFPFAGSVPVNHG